MASLQALLPTRTHKSLTNLVNPPKKLQILSAIRVPRLPTKQAHKQQLVFIELDKNDSSPTSMTIKDNARLKLSTILEFVNDRIEMHHNIGEQRQNWNSLLLNSLNMISLTATAMAGIAGALETPALPLKISSFLLFSAAAGIVMVMNKIQPSQLVEEQRCAVRLLKKLKNRIETTLALNTTLTEKEIEGVIENLLAIDRGYPLPLLGVMLEKFPETFKPAIWWGPQKLKKSTSSSPRVFKSSMQYVNGEKVNGWSEGLEEDMKEIVGVIKSKDMEDYVRLGNKALVLNKTLAVSGPILMGLAAVGSAFVGHGGGVVAAVAGSLATIVNTIEHGGQVGMVFEMYRNCGGFFNLLQETVESNLEEEDLEKRENGEIFEMKMALHLGRSLSELRDLAGKSRRNGGSVNEFANKLF